MVYPLIWLFFGSLGLWPERFVWDSYANGWQGTGQYTYTTFFLNMFLLVVPTVLFTVASSLIVGYGFARFTFPLRNVLFAVMVATLMLQQNGHPDSEAPDLRNLGWLDSYWTFIVPAMFGCFPCFLFSSPGRHAGERPASGRLGGAGKRRILVPSFSGQGRVRTHRPSSAGRVGERLAADRRTRGGRRRNPGSPVPLAGGRKRGAGCGSRRDRQIGGKAGPAMAVAGEPVAGVDAARTGLRAMPLPVGARRFTTRRICCCQRSGSRVCGDGRAGCRRPEAGGRPKRF